MKYAKLLGILMIVAVVFTGCADVETVDTCLQGKEYGFLYGAWHGSIAIFSFIGSLFDSEIAIYAVNNTGAWYDFGYILGLGGVIKLVMLPFRIIAAAVRD